MQCFRFNIPEDDDAHMVFVAIPTSTLDTEELGDTWSKKQAKLEDYYVEQVAQLTKTRTEANTLETKFPNAAPDEIKKIQDEFLANYMEDQVETGLKVRIANPMSNSKRVMQAFFFTPIVVNRVRHSIKADSKKHEGVPLAGYLVCLNNLSNEEMEIQVLVDTVLVSEDIVDDLNPDGSSFESQHLTPLAEQLQESIVAANSVIREMRYMEKREARMRKTAESINSRVKYFSYISVTVLLAVTFVQVSYLKRYFRKKKLM
jgi:p24 family protein delta-1